MNKFLRPNFIKCIMLFCTFLSVSVPIYAENTIGTLGLFIWQKNGEQTIIAIDSYPKISYSPINNTLHIENLETPLIFELNSVDKFTFEEFTPTKINNALCNEEFIINATNKYLSISNLNKKMAVHIYDISGLLIKILQPDENGNIFYPINELNSGIYIIKINFKSFKIIKK